MQNCTSKNTSINSKKLPAIYGKLNYDLINKKSADIIDYGCGRYPELIESFLKNKFTGCSNYIPYDPYWFPRFKDVISPLPNDIFVCSNVLNVIDDDNIVKDICTKASWYPAFAITIYEGDKTGIGKVSKKDCYQRNQKIKDYLQYFPSWCHPVIYKNVITNDKNIISV